MRVNQRIQILGASRDKPEGKEDAKRKQGEHCSSGVPKEMIFQAVVPLNFIGKLTIFNIADIVELV
jgi:hypothetical protein